jgi:hypothetical protein
MKRWKRYSSRFAFSARLSRGGKELLRSIDIRLDGGLTLLPTNGADLTVLQVVVQRKQLISTEEFNRMEGQA